MRMIALFLAASAAVLVPLAPQGQDEENAPNPAPPAEDIDSRDSGEALLIRAGDRLAVSVFKHPELFKTVSVQPDGTVSYPFLGTVKVAGRTIEEFSKEVERALERGYNLRSPRVSVSVEKYAERTAYVLGRVLGPGAHAIPVHRPLTLLQLIAHAGGFTDDADRSGVMVLRRRGDEKLVLRLDLGSFDDPLLVERNLDLQDGDTVIVPRAAEV
ncbi:MAG: polysaccharide biosynthesis/export family protein, partial [Planctomycetota bacterium]